MTDQTQDDSAATSAAFESGFATTRGDATSAPTTAQPAEKAAPSTEPPQKTTDTSARSDAAASDKTSEAKDEWEGTAPKVRETIEAIQTQLAKAGLPALNERLRKFEGNVGGLYNAVQRIEGAVQKATASTQAAGDKAPTQTQVQQAQKDPARWKQLKDDYPEWAEALEPELADIRAQIAAIPKAQPVDTVALEKKFEERLAKEVAQARKDAANEARGLARIDGKHDGWETTIAQPAFEAWYAKQSPEVQALSSSDKPGDAIRMLDLYADHRKQEAAKAAKAAERKQRLERAGTPESVTVTTTHTSAEEAFAGGFDSVRQGKR